MKNAKLYFNNITERNWNSYSLREMIDLLKLPDEGNVNLINIPDLIICIANTRKNYDLCEWEEMFISRSGPDQSVYIQIPHIELSVSHTQFLSLVQINSFITRTGNRDNYSLVRRDILNVGGVSSLSSYPRLLW